MRENRPLGVWTLSLLGIVLCFSFSSCKVYTINKSDLEGKLKTKSCFSCKEIYGLNRLDNMYNKQYTNSIDTVTCTSNEGQLCTKRFTYDTKITIRTHGKKKVKLYAKTLYIWRNEFLVGERTNPSFFGPHYFPVKLSEIASIEIKKPWF